MLVGGSEILERRRRVSRAVGGCSQTPAGVVRERRTAHVKEVMLGKLRTAVLGVGLSVCMSETAAERDLRRVAER